MWQMWGASNEQRRFRAGSYCRCCCYCVHSMCARVCAYRVLYSLYCGCAYRVLYSLYCGCAYWVLYSLHCGCAYRVLYSVYSFKDSFSFPCMRRTLMMLDTQEETAAWPSPNAPSITARA